MTIAIGIISGWMLAGFLACAVVAPALRLEQIHEPFCVGCGCSQSNACITAAGPCCWAALHPSGEYGICSACAEIPIGELAPRGELFA